ncbi:MAG: DUF126 domain-containing protein [Gammaproteobacteria bacterium]|nr:DUF126 domain-containing protein [Gammaproteobacteria bacterium]MDE0259694.1 DUF126 domain-containing protein [Gammaproteobacteria bacterium]
MELSGAPVHAGEGRGPLLVLRRPLSFWGGVDPETGRVSDPRHPQYGEPLGGRILVMERAIGSSSSSAIMLELLRNDVAPAAIVLGSTDAILVLGVLVAEELGYPSIPLVDVGRDGFKRIRDGKGGHGQVRALARTAILRVA